MSAYPLLMRLLATDPETARALLTGPGAPSGLAGPSAGLLGATGEASGPPEAPTYEAPPETVLPRPGLLDRAAAGLASTPGYSPVPYESGGSALVRGLASGAARGFGGGRLLDMGVREKNVAAKAASDKTAADRNYANALESWKIKYKKYLDDSGNVVVGADLVSRYPALAGMRGKAVPASEVFRAATRPTSSPGGERDMVPIPNEPALAKYLGGKPGDMVPRSALLSARSGMKQTGGGTMGIFNGSPEEIHASAEEYARAILEGRRSPDFRSEMSLRDPRLPIVSDLLNKSGADIHQLQLSWRGEIRGLSAANSTPQLRMRQAAETIPLLLEKLAGPINPETGERSGGLYDKLKNNDVRLVNVGGQMVARAFGRKASGVIAEYRVLARKLATEQAFLQAGGNKPEKEAIEDNLAQYDAAASPEVARGGFLGADEATHSFQQSIASTGSVTPSNPYQPVPGPQNPMGGPQQRLGTNPASGTGPAVPNAMPTVARKVRMQAPNGKVYEFDSKHADDARRRGYREVQ